MSTVTYTALRDLEQTGYSVSDVDISAAAADDSINASSTDLSGLLADEWVLVTGFATEDNNGWFQVKVNSTTGKITLVTPPISHLRLPGASGNFASAPDSAGISITGDSSLRAGVAPNDWTPAAIAFLAGQWGAAGQRARKLELLTDGTLRFSWSVDGTVIIAKDSTVTVGFTNGDTKYVMATHDVDNGSTQNEVKFWTSDDGVTWSQLGATVTTAGVTSVFNSNAAFTVGAAADGATGVWAGRAYYADVRATAGTGGSAAAAFDPLQADRGELTFVATTGETWTVSQSGTPPAELQGRALIDEAAGEVVSIVGYARGLNQAYTIEFGAERLDRSVDVKRSRKRPMGGGAPETLLYRREEYEHVRTVALEADVLLQWREFLASVEGGEEFTYDKYGTVAQPDDPCEVVLDSDGYTEERDGTSMRYWFEFTVERL